MLLLVSIVHYYYYYEITIYMYTASQTNMYVDMYSLSLIIGSGKLQCVHKKRGENEEKER
jgi:hypothetical protein